MVLLEIDELIAGDSVQFDIELDVSPSFSGTFIRNWAEISDGTDTDGGTTTIDIDSTPDSTQFNSAGETDDLDDDNVIDEDFKNGAGDPDEDDHDPAQVTVLPAQFDLALKKVLAIGQASIVSPGDKVVFTITVYNQGNVQAYDINVNDYVPSDMAYSVVGSTVTGNLTTANAATTGFTNPNDGINFIVDELASGDNVSFDIAMDVNANFTGTTIRNWAEISDGSDTAGGATATDIDSTPDATNFNQPEESDDLDDDDLIDEDGKNGGDEDDHDPAEVGVTQVFDLALKKVLAAGQSSAITPGDLVKFTITVYNQGTLPAFDVDVMDYIPASTAYSAAGSTASGNVTTANINTVELLNNGDGTFELAGTTALQPGDSVSFDVEVDSTGFTGASLRNWAEISGATDTDGGATTTDIDSTPDTTNFDGAGETNDLIDDNRITEDGKNGGDEDDHDPAGVTVGQSFDLALQKVLAVGQAAVISPGDDVIFTVMVYNQGTLPAFDIDVTDYIPADMSYTATGSTASGNLTTTDTNTVELLNNGDGTFTLADTTALQVGDSVSFDITLSLSASFQGTTIRNWAEISDATDTDGGTTTTDVDSTPSSTNFDDAGETDDLDDDNELNGNGKGGSDEDDHDPAEVGVTQSFDLALKKELSSASTVNPGDDVVFTITIENQGSLDAFDIDIIDYIPSDMSYTATGSTVTGGNITNHGDGTFTLDTLMAGASTTFDIGLTVSPTFQGTSIINWAEISDATDTSGGTTTTDIDSTPDTAQFNGTGETDDLADDDTRNEDGKSGGDEDDHDPAEVVVTQIFDLALKKTLAAGQASTIIAGAPVLFTITVYNQGTVDAFDIDVKDYIPTNTVYSVTNSSATGDLTTLNSATVTLTNLDDGTFEISELAAGDEVSFDMELTTDGTFTGSVITNWAEISGGSATDGGADEVDIDSTPDTTNFDGSGETDDLNDDDVIDEDGKNTGDEDDHDPALVNVTPKPVSIGSYVWEDTNQDGFQQISEPAIEGAIVTLVDASGNAVTDLSGTIVAPQTTVSDGLYLFDNLPEGDYRVRVEPPAIYKKTPIQNGTDNADIEGDSNIKTDITPSVLYESGLFSLAPETELKETNNEKGDDQDELPGFIADDLSGNMTVDFGFVKLVPAVTIEKSTNTEDADITPGPTIAVGAAITWEYVVINTGEVALSDVTITDDKVAAGQISCLPESATNIVPSLAIGATVTCQATSTAVKGAYVNTGSVTGTPPDPKLPPPSGDDPSHYFGGSSSIDIEKATNGEDADVTPGPTINVGDAVTWTYVVTNTGNVSLVDVTVTDDQIANDAADVICVVDAGSTSSNDVTAGDNVISSLVSGETATCTATGTADAGQYTNNASVTGIPPTGTPPTDDDPSHYFGGSSSIDIEKSTNTEDADATPGPTINVGDVVTWSYVVTNTGNVDLNLVTVIDDQLSPADISCDNHGADTNGDNIIMLMAPTDVVNCTATGITVAGQYVNNASVTGIPPTGTPPTDNDPSHYFGGSASINIEKATNGDDADTTPGPTISENAPITWTYRVENTGNVDLIDVTVTDDQLAASDISCPVDDNDNVIALMAPGQVVSCTATGLATLGQYTNNASVTGVPPSGPPTTDDDPSHYFGGSSSIDIEKATNGDDADAVPGPTIAENDIVTWTYRVENTGNVVLTDVTVTDDQLDQAVAADVITCALNDGADLNIIPSLAVGQVVLCTATGVASLGQYTNNTSVIGTPPTGTPPTDNDPSHYFGGSSSIDIEKATNGDDADVEPGPTIDVGDVVTWTYRVENTGNVELTDVTVTDDQLADADISCPVDNNDNMIDVMGAGQVVLCTATGVSVAGQYTNNASVIGTPPTGTPPTDNDPSHYYGGASSIDIEKATNGEDADAAPGPTISIGDAVTWTYRVENTGNTQLTDVIITDDQLDQAVSGEEISCAVNNETDLNIIPTLNIGQVVLCTATSIAVEGQYENQSNVAGTPPGSNPPLVTDNDPSHYFGGASSLDIEKSTNGEDADIEPGPTISENDTVTWTYRVENTGNVALTNVTVTDDQLDQSTLSEEISCALNDGSVLNVIPSLAVGQVVLCTATGSASLGQYSNIASVTGTPPSGTPPTDNDPSHYFGGSASIDIEKATNGDDADVEPGPTISIDEVVTWTYRVENTGNVLLNGVAVTDDQLDQSIAADTISCAGNDGIDLNIIPALAVGQVVLCSATGIADAGQYVNTSSVVGTPDVGEPVSDDDPSHYFGGESSIDIEKSTNGDDADEVPGPTISIGDTVTWTYRVENTGNVLLTDVVVTDDQLAASDITCPVDDNDNVIGSMAASQVILCTATGVATSGQYTNNASVTGTPPAGSPPSDDDPSHYFGGEASIDVEKSTNGEDADETPGPTIKVGENVSWTYVVENTGNVTLTNVILVDDQGVTIACPVADSTPDDNIIDALAVGQVVVCSGSGIALANQYANNVTVTGTPPSGPPTTDNDPSHYFGATSSIALEKATNGEDADAAPGPNIAVDAPVTWTYRVTNTGTSVLTDVAVTDDQLDQVTGGEEITCAVNDGAILNVIPSLAVGQTVVCTASGVAQAFSYANTGLVIGQPDIPGAPPVTDDDPSHYFGSASGISIEKSTNGEDADAEPGPTAEVGSMVTWTYLVTNTGNADLTAVTVTDDQVSATDIVCPTDDGSDNIIDILAVGQSVSCSASGVAMPGQYANTGSVVGTPLVGIPLSDNDPSHYFGTTSSIDIEKLTNGVDADIVPGPTIGIGQVVTWRYQVENTGNVSLTDVTVTDDKIIAGDISCPVDDGDNVIAELSIGQTVVCTATGVSVAGQYENTADVIGTPPVGLPPEDSDPSHYFGADQNIDIEKSTNGADADIAPGPTIAVGAPVTWGYSVTNTGNVRLDDVTVSDDIIDEADIICPSNTGVSNVIQSLTPGQTIVCIATGIAILGDYENVSDVVGNPVDDTGADLPLLDSPTDTDPSHYFGGSAKVVLEKSTNGKDADTPTGDEIYVGESISWTYVVKNTGNEVLKDVTVTDDQIAATDISCGGGTNVIPLLNVNQEMVCVVTGIAVEGQYANIGSVIGTPIDGNGDMIPGDKPEDTDPSHYLGIKPIMHLGSTVFEDPNNNGVQDGSEMGIDGVELQLFETGTPPTGTPVDTQTTSGGGNYLFTGLEEGSYYVYIKTPPTGLELSSVPTSTLDDQIDGDDDGAQPLGTGMPTRSPDIELKANTEFLANETFQGGDQDDALDDYNGDMTIDFGFLAPPENHGTIGDTVYFDENNNKSPDVDEGISGVTVNLYNLIGDLVESTTTDSLGHYLFTGLPVETEYTVKVDTSTLPGGGSGWGNHVDPDTSTPNVGDVGDDESKHFLTKESPVNLDQDFGYIGGINSLSGTLWEDENADGKLNSSELQRLENVTIELRDPITQAIIQRTTTDSEGNYEFVNLPDGKFTVVVTDENNETDGYTHTDGVPDEDNNSQADDGSYVVDLDSNSLLAVGVAANDPTSDFGYRNSTTIPITLGSFVSTVGINNEVEFIWTTQSEIANVGFMLYQKVEGAWVVVNPSLIPAKGESIQLQTYVFNAQGVTGDEFVLVDVDTYGMQTLHGPFALGQSFGTPDKLASPVPDWNTIQAAPSERSAAKARANKQRFKSALDQYIGR